MTDPQTSPHEHWDELAAGHALHALEPADEEAFVGHLATCEQCQASLDDYDLVAAQLGALADGPEEPPAWPQIRSAVTAEPATVVELRTAGRRPRPRWLAAAAAVVVLGAVGALGWQVAARSSGGARTPEAAVAVCTHEHGCAVVRLRAPDGRAPAAVLLTGDQARVAPLDLSAPAAGRQYVLWQLPRDGRPVAVAAFHDVTRQTGPMSLPLSGRDTAAFAISDETAAAPPSRPTHVLAVGSPV